MLRNSDGLGDVLMVSSGALLTLTIASVGVHLHSRWVSTNMRLLTSLMVSVVVPIKVCGGRLRFCQHEMCVSVSL